MAGKRTTTGEVQKSYNWFSRGGRDEMERQRKKEAEEMTPEAHAERARKRKEQEDANEAAAKEQPYEARETAAQPGDWDYIKDKKSKLKSMQGPKR